MKYIVMECHPAYAVVLDENGQFIKVANFRYTVGETVTEVVKLTEIQSALPKKRKKQCTYSAIAVACLLFVLLPALAILRKPVASVYVTINPEVRIDVNRNDIVVDIDAINDDGKVLLENYTYKDKSLDLVLDELVDLAIDKGFLSEGGDVTLTMDADDDWISDHGKPMGDKVTHHISKRINAKVNIKRHPRHDDDDHGICINPDCTDDDCDNKDCGHGICTNPDCTDDDCDNKDCGHGICINPDCTVDDCDDKDCHNGICTNPDCTDDDCDGKNCHNGICTNPDCTDDDCGNDETVSCDKPQGKPENGKPENGKPGNGKQEHGRNESEDDYLDDDFDDDDLDDGDFDDRCEQKPKRQTGKDNINSNAS